MPTPSPDTPGSSPVRRDIPDVETVIAEILRIARTELELPGGVEVTPTSRLLEDLALDSLGLTVLAVGLENRFRVKLAEQDAEGIVTVRDLAALVVRRVQEQEAAA